MTNAGARPEILATKLRSTCGGGEVVPRLRLYELLEAGLARGLTLVSAPAGYGKTTLVCSWLQERCLPSAWLSLDEGDNDLSTFLRYFCRAVNSAIPGACAHTLSFTQAAGTPNVEMLSTSLLNELDSICKPLIVILDDYHVITDEGIHRMMARLVEYRPREVNLVVTCRQDPPLPLARLRARSQITEIRAADLRFSPAEARALLRLAMGKDLGSDVVSALTERTEGWAAGLQLAAISLRAGPDPGEFVAGFTGSNRNIMDYLMDEVISRQSRTTQMFLLRTSILRRMSGALCAAVLAEDRPATYYAAKLARLKGRNLFLETLDQDCDWYRYSQLFRELLQHRLEDSFGRQEISALHCRAGQWFAELGHIDEALDHAVASGDINCAAALVDENYHSLLNRDEWRRLERWLGLLPIEVRQARAGLLLAEAWTLHVQYRLARRHALVDEAEALLRSKDWRGGEAIRQARAAEIALLRAVAPRTRVSDEERRRQLEVAFGHLPQDWLFARDLCAGLILALSSRLSNQDQQETTAPRSEPSQASLPQIRRSQVLDIQCHFYLQAARLDELRACASNSLHLASDEHAYMRVASSHRYLGYVCYEKNDLQAARLHFAEAYKTRHAVNAWILQDILMGTVLTNLALGDTGQADAALVELNDNALHSGQAEMLAAVRLFRARLALAKGDAAAAARLAFRRALAGPYPVWTAFEPPALTYVRVLAALGDAAELLKAGETLSAMLREAELTHDARRQIWALLVMALAKGAEGRQPEASAALDRGLSLAEAAGYVRSVLDLGAPMHRLLLDLPPARRSSPYVASLLAAFGETAPRAAGSVPAGQGRDECERLLEPLTIRETEVLELMAQRLSNKEIAQRLVVSPLTVEKHAGNLYAKLSVNGRRQAVARARTLGLVK